MRVTIRTRSWDEPVQVDGEMPHENGLGDLVVRELSGGRWTFPHTEWTGFTVEKGGVDDG